MRSEITYPMSSRSAATRLAVGFVCWSAVWVIASDYVVNAFAPQSVAQLQTEKGLIYVVVSGLLIWLSVRAMERDEAHRRALNESRLRRLKESGLLGVAGRSADGKITYANETLAQMLGYSHHELIGMQMSKLLSPTYDHLRDAAHQELEEVGRTSLVEVELVRKDGSQVPILGGRARLADSRGEEIVYFIDITELKKSEDERSQLQQQLLHSEKINAIGRLAGGIAHDFNNELAIILGYASLLYARPNADETSLSNVGQILKAAERSRTLIRQLLAFGRKQELRIEVVDLNQVLAEMHSMLRPLLNASIELRVLSTDQTEYAEIDKSQFQQVMMNLAMNAGDAMPDGGVLTIALRESVADSDQEKLETSRESVLLTVTDTGTGIDDSIKSKIFEPFFTTKEQSGGMGLGLAMVYGIVKQNQGDIAVESKPGEGTTFFLRFPRAGKPATSKSEKVIVGPVAALHGTVLLAEDRGDLREMLAEILTRNGLHVLVAFDGENAIEIASETEENIDLVVSDVMMPRMNGPDAVRRIRVSRPTVKAIYLSGYTELGIAEENDILIAKPVTPEALMQAINNCLVGTPPPSKTSAPRKKMAA